MNPESANIKFIERDTMLDALIAKFVLDEINKMSLKDRMVGLLVKKQKRGTFQALQECGEIEAAIRESTLNYVKEWLKNELLCGNTLRKKFVEEVKGQVNLELASKGFGDLIK